MNSYKGLPEKFGWDENSGFKTALDGKINDYLRDQYEPQKPLLVGRLQDTFGPDENRVIMQRINMAAEQLGISAEVVAHSHAALGYYEAPRFDEDFLHKYGEHIYSIVGDSDEIEYFDEPEVIDEYNDADEYHDGDEDEEEFDYEQEPMPDIRTSFPSRHVKAGSFATYAAMKGFQFIRDMDFNNSDLSAMTLAIPLQGIRGSVLVEGVGRLDRELDFDQHNCLLPVEQRWVVEFNLTLGAFNSPTGSYEDIDYRTGNGELDF